MPEVHQYGCGADQNLPATYTMQYLFNIQRTFGKSTTGQPVPGSGRATAAPPPSTNPAPFSNPVRAWNKRSETKRSGVELRAVRTPKRKSRLKWRTHEVRFTGSWVFPSGRCHACGASLPIASPSTRACGKEGHYDSGEEVRATNGDRDSHNRCAAAL